MGHPEHKSYEEHIRARDAMRTSKTRLWTPQPNKKGAAGERAMAEYFGYTLPLYWKPGGDNGIDRWFALKVDDEIIWRSVDVKAADIKDVSRTLLSVNTKLVRAHIYVSANYDRDTDRAKLLGWVDRARVMKADITYQWCGNDADVYQLRPDELRPMEELRERYFASLDEVEYTAMCRAR